MFDIGFSEIALVFIIGLIVLGPERLPDVVKTAAKWIGTVRSMSASVQQQITEELELEEIKKNVTAGLTGAEKVKSGLAAQLSDAGNAIAEAGKRSRLHLPHQSVKTAPLLNNTPDPARQISHIRAGCDRNFKHIK